MKRINWRNNEFNNKSYTVQYLNNVDEENVELEVQAKEVLKYWRNLKWNCRKK